MSEDLSAPPSATRTARLVGFAVVGVIGLYALTVAINLGLWRGRSPGEGLFPFITAFAMILFSAAGIAVARLEKHAGSVEKTDFGRMWRMGFYVAALLFYALTLESLGFIMATIVSVAAILPTGTLWERFG